MKFWLPKLPSLQGARRLVRCLRDKDARQRWCDMAWLQAPGRELTRDQIVEICVRRYARSEFDAFCRMNDIDLGRYFKHSFDIFRERNFPRAGGPTVPRWVVRQYIKWADKLDRSFGRPLYMPEGAGGPMFPASFHDPYEAYGLPLEDDKPAQPATKVMSLDPFYFDPKDIPKGWSYEWKRLSVRASGYPPDNAHQEALRKNHWEPVPLKAHPHFLTEDKRKREIVRQGMLLMRRPKYLTDEARKEDYELAMRDLRRAPGKVPDDREKPYSPFCDWVNEKAAEMRKAKTPKRKAKAKAKRRKK